MSLRRFALSFPIFGIVYLLQEAFVVQMRLPAGGFSLILIFTLVWSALSTPEIGALTGFGAGLLMDLSQTSPGPVGHWTLILILGGYVVAFLGYGDDNIRANPVNIIFLVTIGVVATQFFYLFLGLMLGQEIGSIKQVIFLLAGSAFWTAIVTPLILKIISYLHANVYGVRSRL